MKNNFDQHIKESLESFEADYNPAHWGDMQNRLDGVKAGKSSSSSVGTKLMIAASAVIATAALIYYFGGNQPAGKQESQTNYPNTVIGSDVKETKQTQVVEQKEDNNLQTKINANSSPEKTSAENPLPVLADKKDEKVISNPSKNTSSVPAESPKTEPQTQAEIPPAISNKDVIASFHSDKSSVCAGTQVQFTIDDNKPPCNYKWDFGDGKSSTEQAPKHIYKDAGVYTVKLQATSTQDKKPGQQVGKNMITVHPVPTIDIDYTTSDESPAISFEATSNGVSEWKWDFGDKQISSEKNTSHIFNKKGNYEVTLTGKNAFGCISTYRRNVSIDHDYNLLAPTAFSPNNDGLNDMWIPKALQNGDYIFTLTIYDKNGKTIFKTADKNKPWDGSNANIDERYSWQAVVKDKNGAESIYKGIIVIAE